MGNSPPVGCLGDCTFVSATTGLAFSSCFLLLAIKTLTRTTKWLWNRQRHECGDRTDRSHVCDDIARTHSEVHELRRHTAPVQLQNVKSQLRCGAARQEMVLQVCLLESQFLQPLAQVWEGPCIQQAGQSPPGDKMGVVTLHTPACHVAHTCMSHSIIDMALSGLVSRTNNS